VSLYWGHIKSCTKGNKCFWLVNDKDAWALGGKTEIVSHFILFKLWLKWVRRRGGETIKTKSWMSCMLIGAIAGAAPIPSLNKHLLSQKSTKKLLACICKHTQISKEVEPGLKIEGHSWPSTWRLASINLYIISCKIASLWCNRFSFSKILNENLNLKFDKIDL
jgi:hypothetical protein